MGNKPQHDHNGYWICLLALGTALLIGVSIYLWETRKGCFSFTNYQRIEIGMTIEEVESLLGSPGDDVKEGDLPLIKGTLTDATPNWNHVIWGNSYKWWIKSWGHYILIGIKDGKVLSKWYRLPSL